MDWILDSAANPSVSAGADGQTSSRLLMEHSLLGPLQMFEKCKGVHSGCILPVARNVFQPRRLLKLVKEMKVDRKDLNRCEIKIISMPEK
jgi:CDP-paratose 2-epimerase